MSRTLEPLALFLSLLEPRPILLVPLEQAITTTHPFINQSIIALDTQRPHRGQMPESYVKTEDGAWFKVTDDGHAVSCEAPPPRLINVTAQVPSETPGRKQSTPSKRDETPRHHAPRTFTQMGYGKRKDSASGSCALQ